MCYSFLFYLAAALTFFLICRAFGTHITLLEATSVQVLLCLLTLIPISLGGLGLAQAGDIYLLGVLGIDAATALGISLVRVLIQYGYALLGGILFIRLQGRLNIGSSKELDSDQLQLARFKGGTELGTDTPRPAA